MKTTSLMMITISFCSFIAFSSCRKEADDIMARKTELLVKEPWKFELHGLDENNNGIIEESENTMLACEADDVFIFYANCTGVFTGGPMTCSVEEPPAISFSWRFLNNGTELGVFAAAEMIHRLDENYLEVYYMDENLLGQPVKYIRRFRH